MDTFYVFADRCKGRRYDFSVHFGDTYDFDKSTGVVEFTNSVTKERITFDKIQNVMTEEQYITYLIDNGLA